jgi:hypothetical protein
MKAVSGELKKSDAERAPVFEKKAIGYVKKVLANFDDYEFVRYSHQYQNRQNISYHSLVHWRKHEPGWHGRFAQLPRECSYPD